MSYIQCIAKTQNILQNIQYNLICNFIKMKSQKQSNQNKSLTKQSRSVAPSKKSLQSKQDLNNQNKQSEPAINAITKQNYDIMNKKFNITQIQALQVKYVLKCIEGLFKNRFLYITTHKQGEVIGSGNAKDQGLTLQIQGVGLASKHVKLKFNSFKKFFVKDYGSQTGTWMKIPKEGIQIKNNDCYMIGNFNIKFEYSNPLNQIEQICALYQVDYLADILIYNKITDLPELFKASYQKFKQYPFTNEQVSILKRICDESKDWFDDQKENRMINMYYLNEEIGFSEQIGWQTKRIYPSIHNTLKNQQNGNNCIADIIKGRLYPLQRVFARIVANKNYQLNLHDQIKIGDLIFQLNRFNVGVGQSLGFRQSMQDCYIVQQDIGGSEWKLISLFAVVDGYGGNECMLYIKQNLIKKIRQWTKLLDEAGDLNQMLRVLMSKTFYQLDYQFYEKYPNIAQTCGATVLCMLIIDSKMYVFNLGDNRGFLYRNENIYKLNIQQIPGRADEKARIEAAGGFIQYGRLNGKCTLSRALGQFQYKDVSDYKNNMKGKLKSPLSCIPQVVCLDIQPTLDQFILLSTDGILDVLKIKSVVDFVMERSVNLQKQQNPDKIISSLMENCKITNPQCDNMSAILIFIKKGKIGAKHSF